MRGLKCVDGLVVFAWICSVTLSVPVIPTSGHFFLFWKATSVELLPQIDFLQTKTQTLILAYFQSELVNLTPDSDNKMDAAKIFYERLNLPTFPSENVMRRDNKKPFFFIRGLLKEVCRNAYIFNQVLVDERRFRCNNTYNSSRPLCRQTADISRHIGKVKRAIQKQLMDFFKIKTWHVVWQPKLYLRIKDHLHKTERSDEADAHSKIPRSSDDDDVANLISTVADLDSPVANSTVANSVNPTVADRNSPVANIHSTANNLNANIADRNSTVANRNSTVANRNATVADQNSTVTDRDSTEAKLNATVANLNATVANLNATVANLNATVANLNATVANLNAPVIDLDSLVAEVDSDLNITGYRRRNRASVAVLYAMYVHLHNMEAALKYALIVLERNRGLDRDR